MAKNSVLIAILLITCTLGVAHVAYYYPKLPDTVATHFNARGEADGFSSKQTHAIAMISLEVGMTLLFLGMGWLIKKLPVGLVNMPNREYWLAAERKDKTVKEMYTGFLAMAIGTLLFFIAMDHLSTLQNLGTTAMTWFWFALAAYLIYVTGFCVWFYIKFRLPAEALKTEAESSNAEASEPKSRNKIGQRRTS